MPVRKAGHRVDATNLRSSSSTCVTGITNRAHREVVNHTYFLIISIGDSSEALSVDIPTTIDCELMGVNPAATNLASSKLLAG